MPKKNECCSRTKFFCDLSMSWNELLRLLCSKQTIFERSSINQNIGRKEKSGKPCSKWKRRQSRAVRKDCCIACKCNKYAISHGGKLIHLLFLCDYKNIYNTSYKRIKCNIRIILASVRMGANSSDRFDQWWERVRFRDQW